MLTNRARLFAEYHHTFNTISGEPQLWGHHPYVVHLDAVVMHLGEFGYTDEDWQNAGYNHDVLEDTNAVPYDIEKNFGNRVFNLVYAVTGEGENRKARNASIYAKIADYPEAAILKVADRIANTTGADERYLSMYLKEMDAFYDKVGRYVPEEMWRRLEMNFPSMRAL